MAITWPATVPVIALVALAARSALGRIRLAWLALTFGLVAWAIGEAICAKTLSAIVAAVEEAMAGASTPTEKFRRMFKTLTATGASLFFNDRKLHDIAAHSAGEGWPSARAYAERIRQILMEVVREGRETGEFERKTPLDETVHAIYLVVHPYANPLLLQHNLDLIEEAPAQLSNLVLRSLAP